MNTTPVDKDVLEDAIVNAISSAFDGKASEDEFFVRAVFGLEPTGKVPNQETHQRMMEVIMNAAIGFGDLYTAGEPIDIEKAAQEFLREKLMELSAGDDSSKDCTVEMIVKDNGYGDITYTARASIGYSSSIPSSFLDTAITEARRREGYDEANRPMVLIEPPKVTEPEEEPTGAEDFGPEDTGVEEPPQHVAGDSSIDDEIPF